MPVGLHLDNHITELVHGQVARLIPVLGTWLGQMGQTARDNLED